MFAHRVDRIDFLSSFIPLSLHPMPVKICEKTIDVIGACRISVPFTGIITKENFILHTLGILKLDQRERDTRIGEDADFVKCRQSENEVSYKIIIQI